MDVWRSVLRRRDCADLKREMHAILASYRRHQALLTAVMETADPEVGQTYRELMERTTGGIGRLVIEAGKSVGAIRDSLPSREDRSDIDLDGGARLPSGSQIYHSGPDERLADSIAQIVWSALYHAPAPKTLTSLK